MSGASPQDPAPLLVWNSEMSVGFDELDSHHRRIFELVNALHRALQRAGDRAAVRGVLGEMTQYTIYHFDAEEALMKKHGYPGYQEHRTEHLYIVDKIDRLAKAFYDNPSDDGTAILDFLVNWWSHHIMDTDLTYAPFLLSKAFT